jgi:hypothetical protein
MRTANASEDVTGHYSVDPVNRARCPGVYSWNALWTYLNGGNTMTIPQGWTDDGTTLTAPNGIQVVLGFRDHVLNSNWNAANWPLEPEQHLAIVEQSNPSVGPGQAQTFRWTRLEYTPALGVVEGWLGQELLWYEKDVAALQKLPAAANLQQINTLASQIVKLSTVQ